MLNKLTATLRNIIVSTIVSILALVIGIVLISVHSVLGTVIITLSALAVLYFGYMLIKYIIEHRAAKKEKATERTRDWRDWVISLILLGVVIIIMLLVCRGCGKGITKDMEVLNVGTLNVGISNVETENVMNQTVDTQTVDTQIVENQDVEIQDVGTSNVTEQAVVNQTVDTQVVENQDVDVQDVSTSNVTEQTVVNQTVDTQTVETQIAEREEETQPTAPTTPTTPVHNCSVAKTNKVDATCTNSGKVDSICSCGKLLSSTVIPAVGHKWGDGQITIAATENTTGIKTYTCANCNETKTEKLDKLDHTHKVYDTEKENATCEDDGYVREICSCGKVMSEVEIEATGHSWNKGEITREATEKRTGIKTFTCKKCDETKTETIDKLEHECEISEEIEIEATCTTKGKIKYVCECGEVLDTETTPKLGHDYEVIGEKEPTATKDGYIKYRCNNCDDTYEEVVPATGEEDEEEKDPETKDVYLTASQTYLEAGKEVIITTTGSTKNLEISYDPDVVEIKIISDKKISIKWLGTKNGMPAPTAVSIYDVTAMNEESVLDLCSK